MPGASPTYHRGLAETRLGPRPGPRRDTTGPGDYAAPRRAAVAAAGLWAGLVVPAWRWPPGSVKGFPGAGGELLWLGEAEAAARGPWGRRVVLGRRQDLGVSVSAGASHFHTGTAHLCQVPHDRGPAPHPEIHGETRSCFPLRLHREGSKSALKENVWEKLPVWWVCLGKTGFALGAVRCCERGEKGENGCFLIYINWRENCTLFYLCVCPQATFSSTSAPALTQCGCSCHYLLSIQALCFTVFLLILV